MTTSNNSMKAQRCEIGLQLATTTLISGVKNWYQNSNLQHVGKNTRIYTVAENIRKVIIIIWSMRLKMQLTHLRLSMARASRKRSGMWRMSSSIKFERASRLPLVSDLIGFPDRSSVLSPDIASHIPGFIFVKLFHEISKLVIP